jgi:hypothetical protein
MKVVIDNYPKNPAKKRRVSVRIDKWDTWSMDSTLAFIIYPMLKQLKATTHGAPSDMPAFLQTSDSIQLAFPFYAEEDATAWNVGHQQWMDTLDKMIWSFSQLVENDGDWESQFHSGEHDIIHVPVDKNGNEVPKKDAELFELKHGPNDTHVFDFVGYQNHLNRMKKGFELFGKYYLNLWD